MTPPSLELARRAVACKGWRWMSGMRLECGDILLWSDDHHWLCAGGQSWGGQSWTRWRHDRIGQADRGSLPDLTDPATLGGLLHLVRQAWGAPRALVRLSANGKSFHVFDVDRVTANGNWAAWLCDDRIWQTEAEALVAALEAAPVAGGAR